MNKKDFAIILQIAIKTALENAECKLNRKLPQNVRLLVNSWEAKSPALTDLEAVEELYISENEFYRIIDVGVIRVIGATTFLVARRSGHKPSTFEETWNEPKGSGPFKQIIFDDIELI